MPQIPSSPRLTGAVVAGLLIASPIAAQTPTQIYGGWHCNTGGCTEASVPNMTTFDTDNRWLIDRNVNGTYEPSVDVVVLSFVQPLKLLNLPNDSDDLNGVPMGMNSAVVNYFQNKGVRVMFSIGGASCRKGWDKALSSNPTQRGINAASAAKQFTVGMEIDYQNSSSPNLIGLQSFVSAYRSVIPYDATGRNYAARRTLDLVVGDTCRTPLANYATTNWLKTSALVLDCVNAIVDSQHTGVSTPEAGWQRHVDGNGAAVPPLAAAKLLGSLRLVGGQPQCDNFGNSDRNTASGFVESLAPAGTGTTTGIPGYMFWAARCQGNGTGCTFSSSTWQAGMDGAATAINIPIPMAALHQQQAS